MKDKMTLQNGVNSASTITISGLLLAYFIFVFFFPTIRGFIIGSQSAHTAFEISISIIPEIIVTAIGVFVINQYIRIHGFLNNSLDWIILIYFLSNTILGIFLANDIKLSLYSFRLSYLPVLFYFVGRLYQHFTVKHSESFLNRLLILLAVIAVIGLLLYFVFPKIDLFLHDLVGSKRFAYHIWRMSSIFYNPVPFGTFMAFGAIYCYYNIIKDEKATVHYLLLFLFTICLFLSISRGAIISFIIGWIIISIMHFSSKKVIKTLLVLLISFGIFSYLTMIRYGEKSESISFSSENLGKTMWIFKSSANTIKMDDDISRVELWERSFEDFKQKPMGYGLGKSGHIATRFLKNDNKSKGAIYATDGWFFKLANETGIWGLLSYSVFCFTFLFFLYKTFKLNHLNLAGFVFVVFVMVNLQNIVSNVLDYQAFAPLFWLLIGFGVNENYPGTNEY